MNQWIEKLKDGNKNYIEDKKIFGDVSLKTRMDTTKNGQHPYAIVIACSDSRVIPEVIFSCGIGDLFVIRVAGNVIDDHQLGSIEYAASHLDCSLIVVLGHTHCGAVEAAIHHEVDGYIASITDEIKLAIGDETDEEKASKKNVERSVQSISDALIHEHLPLDVVGALYHIDSGKVEWL